MPPTLFLAVVAALAMAADQAAASQSNATVAWTFNFGANAFDPVISGDGTTIFVGSSNSSLFAVNTAKGSEKWSFDAAGGTVRAKPIISPDGSVVYFTSSNNDLRAVDVATGKQKWRFSCEGGAYHHLMTSPAISPDGSTVFLAACSKLYSLSAADGLSKWELKAAGQVSSPTLSSDGSTVLFGTSSSIATEKRGLYAVNAAMGTQKWFVDTGDRDCKVPVISPDGKSVFFRLPTHDRVPSSDVYAVNAADGSKKWLGLARESGDGPPVVSADSSTVFVASWHYLYALNAFDGTTKWRFKAGGVGTPALSPNGATVVVGSSEKLYAVNAKDGVLEWSFADGEGKGFPTLPAFSPAGSTVFVVAKAADGSADPDSYMLAIKKVHVDLD